MRLILCYTVQLFITKLCTKFHNPRSSSPWEIFDRKCPYALHRNILLAIFVNSFMPLLSDTFLGISLANKHVCEYDSDTIVLDKRYHKDPKFWDARNLCCNPPKIKTKWPNLIVFSQNDANGIAYSEDPGQTAPLGLHCLPRSSRYIIFLKFPSTFVFILILIYNLYLGKKTRRHFDSIKWAATSETGLRGFRPGPTQTGLYNHRIGLEAWNFEFRR